MKKTIVLGDIHGRRSWKQIIDNHPDAERIIFIGDYLDTHEKISGLEQVNNLEHILLLKKGSNAEVILLIGNHDYHYFPGIYSACSGYQPSMRPLFEECLRDNYEHFRMAYVDEEKRVYSHAGITETWLHTQGIVPVSLEETVDRINERFHHKPLAFSFYGGDRSGYGDHVNQSPIWVRPRSLERDGINGVQIVGHTQQTKGVGLYESPTGNQVYYYIDTFGFKPQYLLIEDGIINILPYEERPVSGDI